MIPQVLAHLNTAKGVYFLNSSELEETILESGPSVESTRSTAHNNEPGSSTSGHINRPTTSRDTDSSIVEDFGWEDFIREWDPEEKRLLSSGWHQSTLNTYRLAWVKWTSWCRAHSIATNSPRPEQVARYLANLFLQDGLAYSTILVHKSAIATFCNPTSGEQISGNSVVRHVLRAISVARVKPPKPPIWDVRKVVSHLSDTTPPTMSLYEVARRTATLLLLTSGRRVHDLTLLRYSKDGFNDNQNHITLRPAFGSKTDSANHQQSGWRIKKGEIQNVDPVYWLRKLIETSQERREKGGDLQELFITSRGLEKPASRTIIGNWVKSVLLEAGIETSPGSIRAAVASSNWLENYTLDNILARGNWQHESTFWRHYKRDVIRNEGEQTLPNNHLANLFQPI